MIGKSSNCQLHLQWQEIEARGKEARKIKRTQWSWEFRCSQRTPKGEEETSDDEQKNEEIARVKGDMREGILDNNAMLASKRKNSYRYDYVEESDDWESTGSQSCADEIQR